MPDITMCSSNNCAFSIHCYRHENSGTTPSDFRQSFVIWEDNKKNFGPDCPLWWPIKER